VYVTVVLIVCMLQKASSIRIRITSVDNNINSVRQNCRDLEKLVSKDSFPKPKDFALKIRSTFGSSCMYESTFSAMKQVK